MTDKLIKIVTLSPLVLAFLTLLGYIKLTAYYNFFGIRISDFIDLSEIITYFFDDFLTIISILLIMVFYFLVLYFIIDLFARFKKREKPTIERAIKINFESSIIPVTVVSALLLSVPIVLLVYYPNKYLIIPFILYASQVIILITRKFKTQVIFLILILFISVSLALTFAWHDYRNMILDKPNYSYYIKDGNIVELNYNKRIIGITKNFMFVLDSKMKCMRVVKMNDVSELGIK